MGIFDNRIVFYAYLLLSLAVSVLISFVLYRNFSGKGFIKALLTSLRSLSLFFILLLLTNSFFNFSRTDSVSPKNLILIDNSESILSGNKTEQIRKELTDINPENSVIYEFGNRLLKTAEKDNVFSDSSVSGRYNTNLSSAIEDFKNADNTKINSVIIFSDGMINSGINLMRNIKSLNAPVYYFLAGDTIQKNDVSIMSVNYNRDVFVESSSEIRARIYSHGYNAVLKIILLEEGIPVQTADVKLVNEIENYDISFNIISETAGFKKYTLKTNPLDNEVTLYNNSEEFCIRYIDNNFRILVISGSPSPDFALLKQSLAGSRNFNPEFFVQKTSNSFYEGELPDFRPFDAVILSGFPSTGTNSTESEKVFMGLSEYSNPVLFINASNTDYEKLKKLEGYLPCVINPGNAVRIQSLLRIQENNLYAEKFRKFKLSVPLYFQTNSFSAKPDATIIASSVKENIPAVVIRNSPEHKSALLTGWNYISWNLNPAVQEKDYFQSLVTSVLSVIIQGNKKDILRINTEKTYYAVDEPVKIEIIHDLTEAGAGLSISAVIISGDNRTPLNLFKTSGNLYQTVFTPPTAGDYKIEVSVFEDGKMLASTKGRLLAGIPIEEFRNTRSDNSILSRISAETGGNNIEKLDNSELNKIFQINDVYTLKETVKFILRNSNLYLFIIIFLLSLEWYLRKRFNLS